MPALDTARGLAMVFVCLAHAIETEVRASGWTPTLQILTRLAMIASPSFMLISGMTLGLASTGAPDRFARFREKVLERGVLLLTIGHLLILPAMLPIAGPRVLLVTDTIAVALIVGPAIFARTTARARLVLAAALLALSWTVILMTPDGRGGVGTVLKQTLFGFHEYSWWKHSFPLVPWLSVYLAGSVLGQRIARVRSGRMAARWLLRRGLLCTGIAAGLAVAGLALRRSTPPTALLHQLAAQIASPWRKVPPSPVYLLFFSGVGLLATALVFEAEALEIARWLRERAAELGRASLIIFIAQFYLFYLLMPLLPGGTSGFWPVYFIAGIALLSVVARGWLAIGGNERMRMPGFRALRNALAGARSAG